jgi:3-phenylpropionate/trans-cinnamate dioxygenase ferredoxin reductase subunit
VPLERTLGPDLGRVLQAVHEAHGVNFRMGHTAAEITPEAVWLDDGTELPADLVVVGIGVRPDTWLARGAGLQMENGVVVNEFLETSKPGIYAAGDIARYPDERTGERIRVEHWVVAQRQVQTAAKNILGQREPYTDPPFFWTQQWGTIVDYVGHIRAWEETRVDGDPAAGNAAIQYLKGGKTLALATLGRDLESLRAEAAMGSASRSVPLPEP